MKSIQIRLLGLTAIALSCFNSPAPALARSFELPGHLPDHFPEAIAPNQSAQNSATSDFPLPADAENVTQQPGSGVGGSVNFQTKLTLPAAIEFYRKNFTVKGLEERTANTAITEATFSLVFEGSSNGLVVVVQGVNLGEKRNVNIRYEKLN